MAGAVGTLQSRLLGQAGDVCEAAGHTVGGHIGVAGFARRRAADAPGGAGSVQRDPVAPDGGAFACIGCGGWTAAFDDGAGDLSRLDRAVAVDVAGWGAKAIALGLGGGGASEKKGQRFEECNAQGRHDGTPCE